MQYIYRLRNPVQNYAWGSTTVLADLLGRPSPTPHPQAELWIGAHPRGKSIAVAQVGEVPLDKLVSGTASALLGRKVARAFKNKLPFLLKVLAVERPLSLQVHPNLEQAHRGYKREQASNLDKNAPERNYKDKNHKPEIVCAVTPFSALYGFRPRAETLEWLQLLNLASLGPSIEQLERDTQNEATGRFFLRLLELDGGARQTVCNDIATALERLSERDDLELSWMRTLVKLYPEDPGALAPILLNLVQLEPGQALYTEAGIVHSYLGGTAVELQANSDNVLRGGLTPKHIDLDELRNILRLEPSRVEVLNGDRRSEVETVFETEAREFLLKRLELEGEAPYQAPEERYIEVLLCIEGQLRFVSKEKSLELTKGQSVLLSASTPDYRIEGKGLGFLATVPEPKNVPLAPWEIEEAETQAKLELAKQEGHDNDDNDDDDQVLSESAEQLEDALSQDNE